MTDQQSLLPKEPCPYCGQIAWTWTIENGQNVARPHNPDRCFSKPGNPHYDTYKDYYRD